MKFRNSFKVMAVVLVILLCVIYLKYNSTYTAYRSDVSGNITATIAGWNIKIDGKNINDSEFNKEIKIDDITWNTEHVREGKVSMGSRGVLNINIDPSESDVAILYTINVLDKSIDPERILTVTGFRADNGSVVRTGVSSYSGIITIDDIKNGVMPNLILDVSWIDEGDVLYNPNEVVRSTDYLLIEFEARQYLGETIRTYTS